MALTQHAAAPHILPAFISTPGETDALFVLALVIVCGAVLGVGVLFFWLHSLPERLAHRSHKLQFELVAVLSLLALFTHIHAFWVAALLLALIDLPDISTPFGRVASSLERMAAAARPEAGAKPVAAPRPDQAA